MANFGKKILSAFVEVTEEEKKVTKPEEIKKHPTPLVATIKIDTATAEKFNQYFDKLFTEANLPGPDYFEFSKMIQVMGAIADERARYCAAFAGLNVQGLDKNKLLDTATAYLKILETDSNNFNTSVDAALVEKVQAKQQEVTNKHQRMEQLGRELSDLQNQIQLLHAEIKENEEKIESNNSGYKSSSQNRKQQILLDIEKIKQHID